MEADIVILTDLQYVPAFPHNPHLSNPRNRNLYECRIEAIEKAISSAFTANPAQESNAEPWDPASQGFSDATKGASKYGRLLKNVFGKKNFRQSQLAAINETMSGRDVFVLMPTGAGKSLCYQLPAVHQNETNNSTTVVVSPLRSLIDDQVQSLVMKKITAVGLTADTNTVALKTNLIKQRSNRPALLYLTAEKLVKSTSVHEILRHLHKEGTLARFVIDEAHCLSIWGEEHFRPAYQELHTLRDNFPDVPIMALTSTANQTDIDDINRRLKLNNPTVIRQSLDRRNLNYVVRPKRGQVNDLVSLIKSGGYKSGIIYRTGRRPCERMASILNKKGIKAKAYHAGLSDKARNTAQAEWMSGKCRVIVATIAFGMGIDKDDVQFIVHYDLPKSLENYYQETGRAGRDGRSADCVLYYSFRDKNTILDLSAVPSIERQRRMSQMVDYCQEKSACRRGLLLRHFGEVFNQEKCGRCDNCTNEHLFISRDMSTEAEIAIALVQAFEDLGEPVTVGQCVDVLRGRDTAETRKNNRNCNPQYGACKELTKKVAELLFHQLLYLEVLAERKGNCGPHHHWYLKVHLPMAGKFRC
ncbi:P-loop containing nucleoside triphosphate hydrolase protein [Mycena vitilis]|nr:P-loop containing nucleoside triphosphate hydrolase protein [Mycena vitilis]